MISRIGLVGGAIILSIIATGLVIYYTPLRYTFVSPPIMRSVDPAAFYADMKENPDKYLFIDVRQTSQYDLAHAPGSINVTVGGVYSQSSMFPKTGKTIAIICGDGRSAAVTYGYLEHLGFTNLLHITGGFDKWEEEKLPSESTAR